MLRKFSMDCDIYQDNKLRIVREDVDHIRDLVSRIDLLLTFLERIHGTNR